MTRQLLIKSSIIAITVSLLLVSTFFAGKAVVDGYASASSQNTQAEVANGPCWRCGTG